MNKIILLLLLTGFSLSTDAQTPNPNYDSTLAKKLNADDYGMKKYVLVVLKTGSNTTSDKAFIDSCFSGHMSNMTRMVDIGKLIVAGPFMKNADAFRGLFILNVETIAEANELLLTDPAIKAKLLDPVLYQWYGSAALPEYLEASDKIWKEKP
ncbi:MAG: hypothetical protein IPN36_11295 [Bacteroidetes bacterium]|nr:hypothetical protein [Bacteroidota bacterium]